LKRYPAAHLKALTEWEWPGNVRELANFIERAVILTRGSSLEVPLAELRTVCSADSTHTVSPQLEDIARIVKETINALDSRKCFATQYAEKQRADIVRTLTESRGELVVRLVQPQGLD
jgi:formate hydrogenlyase transcriptional activator